MNSPARPYAAQCQLMTTAPDPATAQAAMELAVGAINTALTSLATGGSGPSVAFQIEESEGQIVLEEQG